MARTPSNMMLLGTNAPAFSLPDASLEKTYNLQDVKGDLGLLVMFICNHCPYVIHLQDELASLGAYQSSGVGVVAISSNDVVNYPADAPDKMLEFAAELGFDFPYLYDESQAVAKAYDAACTPDFFLFDANLRCVYRGRYDASTPGNDESITGRDLKGAIEALVAGRPIDADQHPSVGCNIKWK